MDQENQVEETENIAEQPDAVVAEQTVAQEPEQAPVQEQSVASPQRDGDIPREQTSAERPEATRQPSGQMRLATFQMNQTIVFLMALMKERLKNFL